MILLILVDTFFARISMSKPQAPKIHNMILSFLLTNALVWNIMCLYDKYTI